MYKKYKCRKYIKKVSFNPLYKQIGNLRPNLFPTFLPHLSNQYTDLKSLETISKCNISKVKT
jgi:hypothetical protein